MHHSCSTVAFKFKLGIVTEEHFKLTLLTNSVFPTYFYLQFKDQEMTILQMATCLVLLFIVHSFSFPSIILVFQTLWGNNSSYKLLVILYSSMQVQGKEFTECLWTIS